MVERRKKSERGIALRPQASNARASERERERERRFTDGEDDLQLGITWLRPEENARAWTLALSLSRSLSAYGFGQWRLECERKKTRESGNNRGSSSRWNDGLDEFVSTLSFMLLCIQGHIHAHISWSHFVGNCFSFIALSLCFFFSPSPGFFLLQELTAEENLLTRNDQRISRLSVPVSRPFLSDSWNGHSMHTRGAFARRRSEETGKDKHKPLERVWVSGCSLRVLTSCGQCLRFKVLLYWVSVVHLKYRRDEESMKEGEREIWKFNKKNETREKVGKTRGEKVNEGKF